MSYALTNHAPICLAIGRPTDKVEWARRHLRGPASKRAASTRKKPTYGLLATLGVVLLERETIEGASTKLMGSFDGLRSEGGRIQESYVSRSYESFLNLPVPVVLLAMWLLGATLMGLGGLVAFLYVTRVVALTF